MTQTALEMVERRKTVRRQAQGKVFVLFGQHAFSVGQLLNIGRDGLCCMIDEVGHFEKTKEISLVGYGEGNSFTAIHALPLDALNWQEKRSKEGSGQKIRLRFARLNSFQQSQLSFFLGQYTGYLDDDRAPA